MCVCMGSIVSVRLVPRHPGVWVRARATMEPEGRESSQSLGAHGGPQANAATKWSLRQGGDSDESSSEDEQWGRPWKDPPRSGVRRQVVPRLRSSWSSRDTLMYRKGYPGKVDDLSRTTNYEFYMNQRPSYPDGDFIDNIHREWWGDYHLLERHHGYIQWLFPIRESGMNFFSQELQLHEAKAICANPEAHARVLKSYEMMLDFYGMKLADNKTGAIERAKNYEERFLHLNYSLHNYLRITRILKSLGELNYEHLKAPFVRFVLNEAIVSRKLSRTLESCLSYWLEVVKDEGERADIRRWADELMHTPGKESSSDETP